MRIGGKKIELSNLEKVFWPKEGYTKGDVVNYYRSVSDLILKYLRDRPQSLNRHPDGIYGKNFFQKNMDSMPPDWVETISVYSESEKKNINYMLCQNEATLVYMAQLGCIEINPWNSTKDKLENPDFIVLDLDPTETDFKNIIKVAQEIKKISDELDFPAYCKTSGGKGLHVYIPLRKSYSYNQAKNFAKLLANITHSRIPEITTLNMNLSKRKGKVFIDFQRNNWGQTTVAPYSLRPKEGATISTPLHWEEVDNNLDINEFNLESIHRRLDEVGDIWEGVLKKGLDMGKIVKKIEKNYKKIK